MEELKIVCGREKDTWNEIVHSFREWDIYYLNEYACSLMVHGDGEPLLVYYENNQDGNDGRLCYVVMQRDISEAAPFYGVLPGATWFDWETPYGYGGYLTEGKITEEFLKEFGKQLKIYCQRKHIVSEFVRFHPLLGNEKIYGVGESSEKAYLKDAVYIDTTNKELIMKNMDSKNRNMIRKAVKNHITIVMDHGERLNEFLRIYKMTMDYHEADYYYYFEPEYFKYLTNYMVSYCCFFYAFYEQKVISSALFFYNDRYMHYHLSGTDRDYCRFGAMNLLLYEAACFACREGIEKLYLGGGVEVQDTLFGFKKQFNRQGQIPFYIGRTIFDREAYEGLLNLRERNETNFDRNNKRFIQYRI